MVTELQLHKRRVNNLSRKLMSELAKRAQKKNVRFLPPPIFGRALGDTASRALRRCGTDLSCAAAHGRTVGADEVLIGRTRYVKQNYESFVIVVNTETAEVSRVQTIVMQRPRDARHAAELHWQQLLGVDVPTEDIDTQQSMLAQLPPIEAPSADEEDNASAQLPQLPTAIADASEDTRTSKRSTKRQRNVEPQRATRFPDTPMVSSTEVLPEHDMLWYTGIGLMAAAAGGAAYGGLLGWQARQMQAPSEREGKTQTQYAAHSADANQKAKLANLVWVSSAAAGITGALLWWFSEDEPVVHLAPMTNQGLTASMRVAW